MEIHSSLVISRLVPDHEELSVVGTNERPLRKSDERSDLDWRLDENPHSFASCRSSLDGLTSLLIGKRSFRSCLHWKDPIFVPLKIQIPIDTRSTTQSNCVELMKDLCQC